MIPGKLFSNHIKVYDFNKKVFVKDVICKSYKKT